MGFSGNIGDVVDGNWSDKSFCQTILNNFEDPVRILKKGGTLQQNIEKNIGIDEDFQEYFANKYSLRLLR
jgi:predicted molibdopterin-dependent oxidoreductase YjgC